MNVQKLSYLIDSIQKTVRGGYDTCPSCGASRSSVVDTKYVVTSLRRCEECQLLYRTPITTQAENEVFYQETYTQGDTTDLPSGEELARLVDTGFAGHERDYRTYREVLVALGCRPGMRLFDFGCSWGYGSWQLTQAGYRVTGYEISRPRCAFAREKLGVDAHSSLDAIEGLFDIFFSAHVLEHVPSPGDVLALARRLLRPGGLFVAFTPNGSADHRRQHPDLWHMLWGNVHPNFLDDAFYRRQFASMPYLLTSSPYDLERLALTSLEAGVTHEFALEGTELLAAAKMVPRS